MPDPQAVNTAIELTPIILAIIGGIFAILRAVAIYYIDKRVKDRALADMLENAVQNGLGIIQQAAGGQVVKANPQLRGVLPENLVPGVQYVLDHAGEAVKRFGITPDKIADKLISRIGLKEIETNIAVSTSPTPVAVPPLAPSPPGTTTEQLNREELIRIRQGGLP